MIAGKKTIAMIDTGATRNFMHKDTAAEWKTRLRDIEPYPLTVADGTRIGSDQGFVKYETQELKTCIHNWTGKMTYDVTNIGRHNVILGIPWLRQSKPHIHWDTLTITFQNQECPVQASKREEVQKPRKPLRERSTNVERNPTSYTHEIKEITSFSIPPEYREDFGEMFTKEAIEDSLPPHQPWDLEIRLKDGQQPKKSKIYPLSEEQSEVLREYITEYKARGFIQESKSPAGYPVFFVPKPHGKPRLCVDYRQLNEISITNAYTLPLIQELQDRLQGAQYFTKFDVPMAFHRIRIKKGDEWKTAFRTRFGHYEYKVVPFGLTNAPATWQAYINNILREHLDRFVFAYMDDILVYSRTLKEHVEHVRIVLKTLQTAGLRLEPTKSEFHVQKTKFVGYIISKDGLEADPEKIARIRDWPTPNKVKEVQSFLGFANYYRKFVEGYSRVAAPLTELTRKSQEFEWTDKAQKAFEELKDRFTTPPLLQLFDNSKPIWVETDASDYALGACISQPGSDGKRRPIAYHSRKFSSPETRYSTSDKELLAIVDAFKHWKHYLIGSKHEITVYSDHKNLTTFTTTKELNRRQFRWSEELSVFRYRILHRKGKENANADALSRRPDYQGERETIEQALFKTNEDGSLTHQIATLGPDDIQDMDELRRYQEEDPQIQQLWKEENEDMKEEDGLYTFKHQIFLPTLLRRKYILSYHEPPLDGHARPEEVLERMQRTFYFPRMRQTIFQQIRRCNLCRKAKYERHKQYGKLQPNPAPAGAWEDLTMDFLGPLPESKDENEVTYENIWVIVDRLTKYAHFIPLPRKYDALYLSKVFTREILTKRGLPKSIISDRDKILARNFWGELLKSLNITRKLSTAYHPETDGQTERINQTLEQYLRIYTNDEQKNWVTLLPQAEFVYNNTKQETIGMSPFMANYGREPRNDHTDQERLPTAATKEVDDIIRIQRQLSNDITFLNVRMARYANQKRIEGPTFGEGDKVYLWRRNIKTRRPNSKLDFLKIGPYEVKAKKGPVNYELRLPSQMRIHPVFHVSLLEPADPETPVDTQVKIHPESQETEFEVEKVLDAARKGQQWKYLIKWKNYPETENSWEPIENLRNSREALEDFAQEKPEHRTRIETSQLRLWQQRRQRGRGRS
jgi:hypothetical protein